jgi:threonine dehydratase
MTWVSPYNDWQVIAGQATLGIEILEELQELENLTWIVPVGGGGLLAGIACAVQCNQSSMDSNTRVIRDSRLIGVQSEASPFFHAIYHDGSQDGITELPSLADGLAGRIDSQSITIPILRHYLSDFMLVSEDEIKEGIRYAWDRYQQVIEGSAAAALALAIRNPDPDEPRLVIITGGNIQGETHKTVLKDFGVK